MKVAIVGLSDSSRHLIPWDTEWEVWGLAWDPQRYRLHRAFEMHDMPSLIDYYKNLGTYLEAISHCSMVYMDEAHPDVACSVRYPFEAVEKVCGAYWESSIAYALSLAITEGAEEIALYGIDMTDGYGMQRANCEYLLGIAVGKGIKLTIPDTSPLLKHQGLDSYPGRYGKTV